MSLIIEGGRRLCGDLTVQGAKNSVLPILAACILSGDVCVLQRCPRLEDVDTSVAILRHLGCAVRWVGPDLEVDASTLTRWDIPDRLMRRMRSSVVFLGAILARGGQAELSYPGGCAIGARPIDLHLSALRTLGACIREEGGSLNCTAPGLTGAEIVLSIPSVGATENAMLAAIGASGTTTISNAAREPEIVDLQTFLRKLGANVRGAGTSTVVVEGAEQPLHGCRHRILGDRIAAATYLAAAAAAGGDVFLRDIDYRHLSTVTGVLRQAGCTASAWCPTDACGPSVPFVPPPIRASLPTPRRWSCPPCCAAAEPPYSWKTFSRAAITMCRSWCAWGPTSGWRAGWRWSAALTGSRPPGSGPWTFGAEPLL